MVPEHGPPAACGDHVGGSEADGDLYAHELVSVALTDSLLQDQRANYLQHAKDVGI